MILFPALRGKLVHAQYWMTDGPSALRNVLWSRTSWGLGPCSSVLCVYICVCVIHAYINTYTPTPGLIRKCWALKV